MINQLNVVLFILGEVFSLDTGTQINTNWFKMLGQFFFLVIMFILILLSTYYVTKWIGRFQYKKYQGNNIKVIESVMIAPQKTLQLIKIGNKFCLIGLSKDNIIYLTEIEENMIKDSIPEAYIEKFPSTKFESYLKSWVEKIKKESQVKNTTSSGENHDENK